MRVLMTTFPGKGHFHPIAPLGLALQAAGHDVRVATAAEFGAWVENCGLPVLPAGRSGPEMEADAEEVPSVARAVELFTTLSVPALAADLLAHARDWPPDLVINEEGEHAGPLVAAALGVPAVTHSWPAPARPPGERNARLRRLRAVWRQFGRNEEPRLYGSPYLDCCPPPLQTSAVAGIEGVVGVRPTLFDGPPSARPGWLDEAVRPLIFVTFGTVPRFCRPETLNLIAESVAGVAGTAVIATGPNDPEAVSERANVRTARYLALSHILPLADVVISHAGASTLVACLLEGVPHLAIPQGAPSQERAADSVAAMGLGAVLRPPLHGKTIAATVLDLLEDRDVRPRIRSIAKTLEGLPGPAEVAESLTALP